MNQRRHLQFFVATLVMVIGSSLSFSPQALAAPKLGSACTKAGATTKVSGKTLMCDKKNKKLVWVATTSSVTKSSEPVSKVDSNKVDPNKQSAGGTLASGNFILANPVDLEHVVRLSKFRSCVGHDYSPGVLAKTGAGDTSVESKRSMKHYVIIDIPASPSRVVKGYAPFDGKVSYNTSDSSMGIGVLITSPNGWIFEFMHVQALVAEGTNVRAGDVVVAAPADNAAAAAAAKNSGNTPSGGNTTNVFDIALYSAFTKPSIFESPFGHMATNIAALWSAKGFTFETTVITKGARDAAPCVTDGSWNGNFVSTAPESDYVNAIGYKP
ncbi:MAG: M23 family metallopeptidase [Actinomycetes bacterium]